MTAVMMDDNSFFQYLILKLYNKPVDHSFRGSVNIHASSLSH